MKVFKRCLFVALAFIFFIPLSVYASEKRYNIPIGDSPAWGPENAPIVIIEFIDYQ